MSETFRNRYRQLFSGNIPLVGLASRQPQVHPQGIGMPSAAVSQNLGAASVELDTFGGRLNLGSIDAGQTRSFYYQLDALVKKGVFFDNTGGPQLPR